MEDRFSTITETPGIGASQTQLSMLYTRYKFASEFCKDKEVLEVACGAGQGLGYLARVAKRVCGGDIDDENLKLAQSQYSGRPNIEVRKLDAQSLPFESGTFDVVLLYEAIYYLAHPEKFIQESSRVLRPGGTLLICTVNKEWPDFNPSPFSRKYLAGRELAELMRRNRFRVKLLGGFPVENDTVKGRLISQIKRTAVALHLIPKTMKGKELLKRIFFGKLTPLPREVHDGMGGAYAPPSPASERDDLGPYRVIYAIGSLEEKS